MNKADLLDALEGRLGSRKLAADAVEAFVDVVIREVAAGGRVGITGFGTFEPVQRAARTGRNPRTGETVRIEGTTVARFRPGTQFRDIVADPSTLPATGLVGVRASATTSPRAEAAGETTRDEATAGAAATASHPVKASKGAKATKAEKQEKPAKSEKSPKADKPAKADKPERAEKDKPKGDKKKKSKK